MHWFKVNNNLGLQIAMVVLRRQLYQTIEQVHDCHHDEHVSLLVVGLMNVVLLDERLRMQLGLFTQPVQLHFDVAHWLSPFVLHPYLVFISHRLHLLFILFLCRFWNKLMCNLF